MSDKPTCDTCKHWITDGKARAGLRLCQAVHHMGWIADLTPDKVGEAKAATIDREGWSFALWTRADFGCILREPKDSA